ncbi:MAG: hypothetical protein ACJAW3_001166 [Lentimonas sp.]|jgi:hypothetical protein
MSDLEEKKPIKPKKKQTPIKKPVDKNLQEALRKNLLRRKQTTQ